MNDFTREPPHNFEAEQALLGTILIANAAYHEVAEIVKPEHFADPMHGAIYDTLGDIITSGRSVNVITFMPYVERLEGLRLVGGGSYLARVLSASVHAHDAVAVAEQIADLYVRRRLIDLANKTTATAYGSGSAKTAMALIEQTERELLDLAGHGMRHGGARWFEEYAMEAAAQAEAAYSRAGDITGASTGFTEMDQLLGGLRRSDLIILAGRPSMGKTALATNISINAAKAYGNRPGEHQGAVAFYSLEMSGVQLAMRVLAEQAGIVASAIPRGQFRSVEFDRFLMATENTKPRILIDEAPALSISALRSRARRLKALHGLGLIVVDYLQLLEATPGSREGRVQQISEITRGLKTMAKELDVPVLALSQLSRDVEKRDDKRPQLSDLRESGSIEQDADVVMFVYRDEYYLSRSEPSQLSQESAEKFNSRLENWQRQMEQAKDRADVIVAKHRHGATGTIRLAFDGRFTRFSDLPPVDGDAELPL
ncbi:MAG: replicative DNA helicase [Rhodospirillaceae bacterium]|nr:MAG: replicative DNA helicase [Rhodospirillaceae bacterium]